MHKHLENRNKFDHFVTLYNHCILNGSLKRKNDNKYSCGQNIDDKDILSDYK
jgi:hypothetical protein